MDGDISGVIAASSLEDTLDYLTAAKERVLSKENPDLEFAKAIEIGYSVVDKAADRLDAFRKCFKSEERKKLLGELERSVMELEEFTNRMLKYSKRMKK